MKLYETSLRMSISLACKNPIEVFRDEVSRVLPKSTVPIRFVITQSDLTRVDVELGVVEAASPSFSLDSIFDFRKREVENTAKFNAVLVVPTGIGARIGGHAGDAAPVSRLMASICDNLITHPNVVNASDINEITENTLYTEGSVICRLLMGTAGLAKVRSNRVLVVLENHPTDELFVNGAINAVNAARASGGLDCSDILVLEPSMRLTAEYSPSGRAIGKVDQLDNLFAQLRSRRAGYDAVAISSIIRIPSRKLHAQYFESNGEMTNPWGGVEAIFTHAVSAVLNVQSAHSPMIEDQLVANMDVGVVDPRQAAEAVSFTYMHCILKGLQRAPKVVTDTRALQHPAVLTASDVSCLIIPDGCIGLPTLAALGQGIPVIAVRENTNLMKNDLTLLPWAKHQLHFANTYLEAVGIMAALKNGIAMDTLRRPLAKAEVNRHEAENLSLAATLTPAAASSRS